MAKPKGVDAQLQRFSQQAQQVRILQIGAEPLVCKCGCDVLISHQLVRVKVSRLSKQMQLDSAGVVFSCAKCNAYVAPDGEPQAEDKPQGEAANSAAEAREQGQPPPKAPIITEV